MIHNIGRFRTLSNLSVRIRYYDQYLFNNNKFFVVGYKNNILQRLEFTASGVPATDSYLYTQNFELDEIIDVVCEAKATQRSFGYISITIEVGTGLGNDFVPQAVLYKGPFGGFTSGINNPKYNIMSNYNSLASESTNFTTVSGTKFQLPAANNQSMLLHSIAGKMIIGGAGADITLLLYNYSNANAYFNYGAFNFTAAAGMSVLFCFSTATKTLLQTGSYWTCPIGEIPLVANSGVYVELINSPAGSSISDVRAHHANFPF